MLEIVQDQQHFPLAQKVVDDVSEGSTGWFPQPQCRRQMPQQKDWITQRGQIDEDPTIGERVAHPLGYRQRQPRLTHTPWSSQGDEPHRAVPQESSNRFPFLM